MRLYPNELKRVLERLHGFAKAASLQEFEAEWRHLEGANDLQKAESEDIQRYFNLFLYNDDIKVVFKEIVRAGDKALIQLFFESGLIDSERLVASLYPERAEDNIKDSLLYKCIKYDVARQERVFLDLLFAQIPAAELSDFIEAFKALYIPTFEVINAVVTQKLLVYLAEKKYLDLAVEVIANPGEKLWQQALFLQIIVSIVDQKELSEDQVNFLKKYSQGEALVHYLTALIGDDGDMEGEEIRNLINNKVIREILAEEAKEIDQLYYVNFLEKPLLAYQSQLESLAVKGDFDTFKQKWAMLIKFYQQNKAPKAPIVNAFNRSLTLIFKQALKGGNAQLVNFIWDNDVDKRLDINQVYNNTGQYSDEPFDYFNLIDLAAYCNNLEMVDWLLNKGANPVKPASIDPKSACSPLAIAINKANPKMVAFLLEKGASVWDEKQGFGVSAIEAAIVSDFSYASNSAYYLNLLLTKLSISEKDTLFGKFKLNYLPWLVEYRKPAAEWTLNFLLQKDHLQVDDLLRYDYYNSLTSDSLLEKIIQLNEFSPVQQRYLSRHTEKLNLFIAKKAETYSPIELEQLEKSGYISSLLSNATRKALLAAQQLNECRDKPLSFALLTKIMDSLDKELKAEAKGKRKVMLPRLAFYQELLTFSVRVRERVEMVARRNKVDMAAINLDENEVETLAILIDEFKNMRYDSKEWYSAPLQLAAKKLAYTANLSLRLKPAETAVSNNLPEVKIEQFSQRLEHLQEVIDKLADVDSDGKAVQAFIAHLLSHRSEIEKFFIEKYKVFCFEYTDDKNNKTIQVLLHTENIPRGKVAELNGLLDRLIQEYFSYAEIAEKAGKIKEFFGKLSGLCIEGRLRGSYHLISGLLEDVPRLEDVMQEAFNRFNAYTSVMEPDILEAMREFKDDENIAQGIQEFGQYSGLLDKEQALAFILPRVIGKKCVDEDEEGAKVQKIISPIDVETYLDNLYCDTDNSFVFMSNNKNKPLGEFEFINPSDVVEGPFKLEEVSGVRLKATQLNNLILSYLQGPAAGQFQITHESIKTTTPNEIVTDYLRLFKEGASPLFVFQAVRDSRDNNQKEKLLPFVNSVIQKFLAENANQEGTLLIPLMQTRLQLGKKQHAVLLELTIKGEKKEITIHNSQSRWRRLGYRECLKELKIPIKYQDYAQQTDDSSCCFFVYSYMKTFVRGFASQRGDDVKRQLQQDLKKLRVDLRAFSVAIELNANFAKLEMPAERVDNKSMSSRDPLSWEKTALLKHFDKAYLRTFEEIEIDFDELKERQKISVHLNPNQGLFRSQSSPKLPTEGEGKASSRSTLVGSGLFRSQSCAHLQTPAFDREADEPAMSTQKI